jgi:hypothetical protein
MMVNRRCSRASPASHRVAALACQPCKGCGVRRHTRGDCMGPGALAVRCVSRLGWRDGCGHAHRGGPSWQHRKASPTRSRSRGRSPTTSATTSSPTTTAASCCGAARVNPGSTMVRDFQSWVTFTAANLRNERGEIKQAQSQSDHADEGFADANEDVAELWRLARRLPSGRQHLPSPKARSACRP